MARRSRSRSKTRRKRRKRSRTPRRRRRRRRSRSQSRRRSRSRKDEPISYGYYLKRFVLFASMFFGFVQFVLPRVLQTQVDAALSTAIRKFESKQVTDAINKRIELTMEKLFAEGETNLNKPKVQRRIQTQTEKTVQAAARKAIQEALGTVLDRRLFCKLYARFYNSLKLRTNNNGTKVIRLMNATSLANNVEIELQTPQEIGCGAADADEKKMIQDNS